MFIGMNVFVYLHPSVVVLLCSLAADFQLWNNRDVRYVSRAAASAV